MTKKCVPEAARSFGAVRWPKFIDGCVSVWACAEKRLGRVSSVVRMARARTQEVRMNFFIWFEFSIVGLREASIYYVVIHLFDSE